MVSRTIISSSTGGNFAPLTRQPSIYSVTLQELQKSVSNGPEKSLGSMNMEDFMKNVWTAEEGQAISAAMAAHPPPSDLARQPSLLLQSNMSLLRTLSGKTVEDIWKEIQPKAEADSAEQQQPQPRRLGTVGEMTLEDFLVRTGVVKEDGSSTTPEVADAKGELSLYPPVSDGCVSNLPFSAMEAPNLQADWMSFGTSCQQQQQQLLQQAGALAAAKRGPNLLLPSGNPAGLSDNASFNPGRPTLVPAVPDYSMQHSRKRGPTDVAVERSLERRQQRMIKNRESAARSRARRQAYTVELEAEVTQLKEENTRLKKLQALESRSWKTTDSQQPTRVLRRTCSW